MNVLVIPSWCPSVYAPLRGTFFLEQSDALARLRPDWNVVFLSWDPDTSKLLTRHPRRFFHTVSVWQQRRLGGGCLTRRESGLYLLDVWTPVLRTNTPSSMLYCLQKHLDKGLDYLAGRAMTPDIILAHASMPAGKAASDVYRLKRIPYILTEHMQLSRWPGFCTSEGLPLPEIYDAYANAQKCLAVSRSLAADLRRYGLADDINVLPNGVNSEFFSLTSSPSGPNGYSFLSIGWPSKDKGTDILLKAFAQLHAERRNTVMHIVGSSQHEEFFREMAVSLKIQDAVVWKGNVPRTEIPSMLAACDAFVLPSASETFGVAYVEALMCGKPIIATACGGPEDIVTSQNGYLIPVGDVGALAQAMRDVMEREFSATDIRADAVARFSMLQTSSRLASIIEESV